MKKITLHTKQPQKSTHTSFTLNNSLITISLYKDIFPLTNGKLFKDFLRITKVTSPNKLINLLTFN